MIFKSSKRLLAGTIAAALCVTAASLNITSCLSSNAASDLNNQFYIDGYHYEFTNMSEIGECSFEPDYEGGYSASWSGVRECRFDKGLMGEEMPADPESVILDYDLEFSPVTDSAEVDDGSSRVSAYGWLVPASQRYNIEYTIVDYQCNFDTENYARILELDSMGSYEIDGAVYDLYCRKAANTGFSFEEGVERYFSIRHDCSIGSGASVNLKSSIDITRHISEWQNFGMEESWFRSAMLDIDAWMSSGRARLNSCDITFKEKEREAFTEAGWFYVADPVNSDGSYKMQPLGDGGMEVAWDTRNGVTFRKGRSFADAPFNYNDEAYITADYDVSLSADSDAVSDISIHGWLDIENGGDWKDEFNIVLGRQGYFFPENYDKGKNDENVIELGTVEDNGKTFRLYRSIPKHSWGISGISERTPYARYTYWSVAEDCVVENADAARLMGSVNIRKHLEKMMEKASELERTSCIYELSFDISGMKGAGNAVVNSFDIFISTEKYGEDISSGARKMTGEVTFSKWGSPEDSISPNGQGGFLAKWEGDEYKFRSFSARLDADTEINADEFSMKYDADVNMFTNENVEWALCGVCKSSYSTLEYYVFENYSGNALQNNCGGTYSFLRNHSVLKRNTAIINGEKYDIFYLRYKVGGVGVYDIFRCVSVRQNAAADLNSSSHLSGEIDWTKHIMVWDSAGFPVAPVNSCELMFETNSTNGGFSLNTCEFNMNAKEKKGDLNGDGIADNFDVIACRRALIDSSANGYDVSAGDMNGNGKLDVGDLVLLTRFILGTVRT